jgi:hypothetical protein
MNQAVHVPATSMPQPVELVHLDAQRARGEVAEDRVQSAGDALREVGSHAREADAPIDAFSANRRPAVGSGPGALPDGSGGANPADGTGLTGLLDRIEARDGTLTITSPPGLGTTLHATLPLRDMES